MKKLIATAITIIIATTAVADENNHMLDFKKELEIKETKRIEKEKADKENPEKCLKLFKENVPQFKGINLKVSPAVETSCTDTLTGPSCHTWNIPNIWWANKYSDVNLTSNKGSKLWDERAKLPDVYCAYNSTKKELRLFVEKYKAEAYAKQFYFN